MDLFIGITIGLVLGVALTLGAIFLALRPDPDEGLRYKDGKRLY